jgi:hypothetical protein
MPSLGIAPRSGGCIGPAKMPTQIAPVSGVFPADAKLHRPEIRIQAIQLFTISRGSPKRLVPYAWTRPLVFWHACLVTFTFQIQVSHRTQECSSKFLPTTPGIQHGASWRSDSSLSVRRYRSTAACTDGGAGRGRPDLFGPPARRCTAPLSRSTFGYGPHPVRCLIRIPHRTAEPHRFVRPTRRRPAVADIGAGKPPE